MKDLLFAEHRRHPAIYEVPIQGQWERTVSIRGGISWPQVDTPGYFVLVAQLERKDGISNWRFLAFYEDCASLKTEFFEKIASACLKWRVDGLIHGGRIHRMPQKGGVLGTDEERSFGNHLFDFLRMKEARYELIQRPQIGPSFRSKEEGFLTSLLRDHINAKTLLLFQRSDGRTPLLLERICNTDMESNILGIPELRALAYVMDDFDCSPWRPSEPPRKKHESAWGM